MLKRATQSDSEVIKSFCDGSVPGTRIACLAECYGFERDFAEFWIYSDEEGIGAVLGRLGDDITLHVNRAAVPEDLCVFAAMSGCNSFMSDVGFQLEGYNIERKQSFELTDDITGYECNDIREDDMRQVYNLIGDNISGSFSKDEEAYLAFLSDFTFRRLRGRARGKVVRADKVVACGITSAETDTSALLSGIACDKSTRGTGAGKKIVLSLAEELQREGKRVYVIALNASAEGFYRHIGFTDKETVYVLKGNNNV